MEVQRKLLRTVQRQVGKKDKKEQGVEEKAEKQTLAEQHTGCVVSNEKHSRLQDARGSQ